MTEEPKGDRLELPSGGWAEFRHPETMTNGQRKPLQRALFKASQHAPTDGDGNPDLSKAEADEIIDITEAMVRALVSEWSFEAPAGEMDDIPATDADALMVRASDLLSEMAAEPEGNVEAPA